MDDGTLGSDVSSLLHNLETVRRVGPTIDLLLNEDKCELVTDDDRVVAKMRAVMPNIRHIQCGDAVLLGAPVGETAVNTVLNSKLDVFRLLASRLTTLNPHMANDFYNR